MAKPGLKYGGLSKRDSYEGLIDYLENKQDKLKLPDREAKFVRDSPQYQSLLNEGFLEVEKQQINQIKSEQEEHAVIRTANDTHETAKEVRVVSSQTDKPLSVPTTRAQSSQARIETKTSYSQSAPASVKSTGSQSTPKETKSTSSQSAQIFDMTLGENLTKAKQEIESVENTTHQNKQQQLQNIVRMVDHNLRNVVSPNSTIDFAHSIASKGVSGLMRIGSVAFRGMEQLSASSSQEPQYSSLLLGDGRGRQDWYTMNPQQLNLGDKPNLIPISFNPNPKVPAGKSKTMEIDDAVTKSKPKGKPKPKSMTVAEQDLFDEIDKNTDPKPKPKTKPKPQPSSSASSSSKQPYTSPTTPASPKPPVKNKILKTKPATPITTGTQIPPSKIGIQKLKEELENAKNKGKLNVSDTSTYMKHYDDWKSSKNDKAKKDEHLKGLRELYKRVLYKK